MDPTQSDLDPELLTADADQLVREEEFMTRLADNRQDESRLMPREQRPSVGSITGEEVAAAAAEYFVCLLAARCEPDDTPSPPPPNQSSCARWY
jgi:hypothetical protein